MRRAQPPRASSIRWLIFLALLAAAPGAVFAQGGSLEVPENASAKTYGSGWECDPGYREIDEACAAVKVPANAYPTNKPYGRGWVCGRGFREVGETCAAIEVPANAYLNSSGDKWECERGYRDVGGACDAIKVPEKGFLTNTSYGSATSEAPSAATNGRSEQGGPS